MSEALPEPSLPIFGEKTVFYHVIQHRTDRLNPAWETVRIPVDEIDAIENTELRAVLWSQFKAEETDADSVILPFVHPDGRYSHAFSVYKRPLGVTFTSDGVIENENLPAYRESKSQEMTEQQQKSASWITRLLKRNR
jgi:hypothetical protein